MHDGVARLTDMHKLLIKEKLINGIEIVNEDRYSDKALEIALENNLTFIGASDIHGLIDWTFKIPQGGHRPITLVFAKEKTKLSTKKALFEGNTAIWFKNMLIGKQEFLKPLVEASLVVEVAEYQENPWTEHKKDLAILNLVIQNDSDAEYILENTSEYRFHKNTDIIVIPANHNISLEVKTLERKETINLSFKVLNTVVAPKKYANIQLKVVISK